MIDLKIIDGDILESDAQYIAHQCNCKTKKVAGLALKIFKKFPWADIKDDYIDENKFGFIDIKGNGEDQRFVINMFAQIFPGKITEKSYSESEEKRKLAFLKCLKKISEIEDIYSIDFPYGIGCGLAGGDWDFYKKAIKAFAISNKEINVRILRFF